VGVGIRNFVGTMTVPGPLVPADGLGVGNDPERFLDKIPDVRPIRYHGLLGLLGMDVCAVVYDGDISVNYIEPGVEDANLQGANLGIVAFRVLQVIPFGPNSPFDQGNDPQEIAKVKIKILDAKNNDGSGVCQGDLGLYDDAPDIIDEDTSRTLVADIPPGDTGSLLTHIHPMLDEFGIPLLDENGNVMQFNPFDTGFGEDPTPP